MLLLGMTAFANSLLLLVVSAILLLAGLILLPRDRTRGMFAALIGASVAAFVVAIIRLTGFAV